MKCETIHKSTIEELKYYKEDLVEFFTLYNKCHNSGFVDLETKTSEELKSLFNLNFRLGLNSSDLQIEESDALTDFRNKLHLRIGVEAEFILGFNKNKWAIIVEPNYGYYKAEKRFVNGLSTVDYKYLSLPIGVRHYLFLNQDSKFFINSSYSLNFGLNSTIEPRNSGTLTIRKSSNLDFGIGHKYLDKYNLEFRYSTSPNLLDKFQLWKSEYNTISLVFGYTIL